MTRLAGIVLAALLLVVTTCWAAPPRAYACSCAYERDDPELVRIADVIFVGTVVGDRTLGDTRTYTFTVDRVFKGQAYATQTLTTHAQGPACGLDLTGSGQYLVHARLAGGLGGALEANSCGGTQPGGPSVGMGEGYPPLNGGGIPNGPRSLIGPAVILVVISAAFALTALAWRRRLARPEP
jgi:hypothetical protein